MAFTANVNLIKFNQIIFDFMDYYGIRLHLQEYEISKYSQTFFWCRITKEKCQFNSEKCALRRSKQI